MAHCVASSGSPTNSTGKSAREDMNPTYLGAISANRCPAGPSTFSPMGASSGGPASVEPRSRHRVPSRMEDREGCPDEPELTEAPDTKPQTRSLVPSGEAPPTGRLGQGGLRALVYGFLADHADTAHSPTKISRQLGRSSGAVANALVTLVNLGRAEMVTVKPRTYRLVSPPTQPK
jgi:hypothetical protein